MVITKREFSSIDAKPVILLTKRDGNSDVGYPVDVQNPMAVDGDSVYSKDLDIPNCSIGDFSGSITDLFDNRTTTITTTADNPSLTIALKRPVINHELTLVAASGNFSNVTIVAKDASGATLETIDDSANDTDYTARTYHFLTADRWCVIQVSFTTTDTVSLSFAFIPKATVVDAHLVALKPDGTDEHINATAGGNLKVSIEEVENSVNLYSRSTDMEGGGKNVVGTSAVEVTFTNTDSPRAIFITSDTGNTGELYIGKSDVTSSGTNAILALQPGEAIEVTYDDTTNAIYVVSDTAAQNFWKGAFF